jgi:hypothetical protein
MSRHKLPRKTILLGPLWVRWGSADKMVRQIFGD